MTQPSETAAAFAAKLNNRQYRAEMTREEEAEAKACGLLVLFGASDDLLEFRGMLRDEAGAWEGAEVRLRQTTKGLRIIEDREDARTLIEEGWTPPTPLIAIKAEWSPADLEASWRITADVPFAAFDIMEDDQLYCRGAVIDLDEVRSPEDRDGK